jgi:hypothetical protein
MPSSPQRKQNRHNGFDAEHSLMHQLAASERDPGKICQALLMATRLWNSDKSQSCALSASGALPKISTTFNLAGNLRVTFKNSIKRCDHNGMLYCISAMFSTDA